MAFDNVIKNVAEKSYSVLHGNDSYYSQEEGTFKRRGFIGRYLNKLDETRMADLQTKFAATPMGAALLGYAADNDIKIGFEFHDKNSNIGAAMIGEKTLMLNPQRSDDMLVGAIAHELRHSYQNKQIAGTPGNLGSRLPPESAVAVDRYMEADARVFQQKYVEDYAARTGNDGPLKAMMKIHGGLDPKTVSGTDAQRFTGWCNYLQKAGGYDAMMLGKVQGHMQDREKGFTGGMISQDAGRQAALGVARRIDGAWPYPVTPGKGYLSGVSDAKLTGLGGVHPGLQGPMTSMMNSYNKIFAATNPTVGATAKIGASIPSAGGGKR
ncbi:MAG: hypothetical protein GC185_05340 [Alphaproteobacteria bacterium]|nr:hypothetical protein [Alphaproteobacteria bacterium]